MLLSLVTALALVSSGDAALQDNRSQPLLVRLAEQVLEWRYQALEKKLERIDRLAEEAEKAFKNGQISRDELIDYKADLAEVGMPMLNEQEAILKLQRWIRSGRAEQGSDK